MDFKKKGNSTLAIENNKIVGIIKPMAKNSTQYKNNYKYKFNLINPKTGGRVTIKKTPTKSGGGFHTIMDGYSNNLANAKKKVFSIFNSHPRPDIFK